MTRTLALALGLAATLTTAPSPADLRRAPAVPARGGAAEAGAMRRFELASTHMGTRARIVVYAADTERAEAASRAAFARIALIDARLSDYRDTSEVAALARSAGGAPLPVSLDLVAVLQAAQDLARRSHGAFDVTCGPLSRLWRRARRTNVLPTPGEIAAARRLVGFEGLEVDPAGRTVRLARPGMRLDLGGIAKGYAADEALRTLAAHGFDAALVELGGEVVTGAPPPGLAGWTVGRPSPAEPLLLAHGAASTSGDTEQWLEVEGVRYSHVFDPRSGEALQGHRSVTVVARRGIDADALATAASVLGMEAGRSIVEAVPGATVLGMQDAGPEGSHAQRIIDTTGGIHGETRLP